MATPFMAVRAGARGPSAHTSPPTARHPPHPGPVTHPGTHRPWAVRPPGPGGWPGGRLQSRGHAPGPAIPKKLEKPVRRRKLATPKHCFCQSNINRHHVWTWKRKVLREEGHDQVCQGWSPVPSWSCGQVPQEGPLRRCVDALTLVSYVWLDATRLSVVVVPCLTRMSFCADMPVWWCRTYRSWCPRVPRCRA